MMDQGHNRSMSPWALSDERIVPSSCTGYIGDAKLMLSNGIKGRDTQNIIIVRLCRCCYVGYRDTGMRA
jgi:hypothetical protein